MFGVHPCHDGGVSNIFTTFFVGLVAYGEGVGIVDFCIVVELVLGSDPAFHGLGDRMLLVDDFYRDGSSWAVSIRE